MVYYKETKLKPVIKGLLKPKLRFQQFQIDKNSTFLEVRKYEHTLSWIQSADEYK